MQARLLPGFLFHDRIRVALPGVLHLGHRARQSLITSQQRAWATVGSSRSALGGRRVVPQRRVWSTVGSPCSAELESSRSDHPAVSNLCRARVISQRGTFAASRSSRSADSRSPRPRHCPEVVAGRLKTKKLQKCRNICFCEAPIVATRQIPQRVSRPNRGIMRKRIDAGRQQRAALFEL